MAILDELPAFEVTVNVAGQLATEYEDPDPADPKHSCPTSSKYIQSVSGAVFTVHFKVRDTYVWAFREHSLRVQVRIDGNTVRSKLVRSGHIQGPAFCGIVDGRKSADLMGRVTLDKFKFAAVTTVDDAKKERVEEDRKKANDLGLIEVLFYRCTEDGIIRHRRTRDRSGDLEIAEKALKGRAVSHGTVYDKGEVFLANSQVSKTTVLPEDDGPIAVFQFYYRSKDDLRHQLIIPRSPSRSPTLDGLSSEEIRRLALQTLKSEKVKRETRVELSTAIKRERRDVVDLTRTRITGQLSKRVKREGSGRDAFIDLTDD